MALFASLALNNELCLVFGARVCFVTPTGLGGHLTETSRSSEWMLVAAQHVFMMFTYTLPGTVDSQDLSPRRRE